MIILFSVSTCFSQTLSKSYIDNWIECTFNILNPHEHSFYILNGILLENDSIEIKLAKLQINDLAVIDFLDKPTMDSLGFCNPLYGVVLLVSKDAQTDKAIEIDLNKARSKYSKSELNTTADIDPDKAEPVLILNGKQVYHTECYDVINKLKTRRISAINYIRRPVSEELYGANAINGLIIISTK